MSYQKITGPLMANSHPGSYCGQDAYNDMLVTERNNELCDASNGLYKESEQASSLKQRDHKDATDLILQNGGG